MHLTILTELVAMLLSAKQHVTRGTMVRSTAYGLLLSVNLMHQDPKMEPSESGSWVQLTATSRRQQVQTGRQRSG